jgi:hypothetical protein
MCVQQPALDALLERLEDRLPIHAGGLHPGQRHTGFGQPSGELGEPAERGTERSCLLIPPSTAGARNADGRHDVVAMDIETRAALHRHIPEGTFQG